MEVLLARSVQTIGLIAMVAYLGACSESDGEKPPEGDGTWLLISAAVVVPAGSGDARIIIQKGKDRNTLSARYQVSRRITGGAWITLSTHCGSLPLEILLPAGVVILPDTRTLDKDEHRIPNCGLGEKLMRAGAWHLLTNRKI